jgi:hypothetical protein
MRGVDADCSAQPFHANETVSTHDDMLAGGLPFSKEWALELAAWSGADCSKRPSHPAVGISSAFRAAEQPCAHASRSRSGTNILLSNEYVTLFLSIRLNLQDLDKTDEICP